MLLFTCCMVIAPTASRTNSIDIMENTTVRLYEESAQLREDARLYKDLLLRRISLRKQKLHGDTESRK